MIKAITLDLGGVVVSCNHNRIIEDVADHVGSSAAILHHQLNLLSPEITKGFISLECFYGPFLASVGSSRTVQETLDKHLDAYRKYSTQRDEKMLALIDELKSKYIVACMTNTEVEIEKLNREAGLFELFEPHAYISTRMRFIKPDKEAYEKVCGRLGVMPSEVLFADDSQPNILGARIAGWNAMLYTFGNSHLLKDKISMLERAQISRL